MARKSKPDKKAAGARPGRSYTAEKKEAMRILRALVRDYAPFRCHGVHPKRGRCACGGLAIRRLIFTGKHGKKLLLHPACADSLRLKAKP